MGNSIITIKLCLILLFLKTLAKRKKCGIIMKNKKEKNDSKDTANNTIT